MIKKYDTPLLQDWKENKDSLPSNTLLAVRLGDFWEFFEEDAEIVGAELSVTVTNRRHVKMAGLFVFKQETDEQFEKLNKKYNIAKLEYNGEGKRELVSFSIKK